VLFKLRRPVVLIKEIQLIVFGHEDFEHDLLLKGME
jgi:hypothetical protein